MTYISWFSGLYLEDYFMYKAVTLAGGIREPLLTCSSYYNLLLPFNMLLILHVFIAFSLKICMLLCSHNFCYRLIIISSTKI